MTTNNTLTALFQKFGNFENTSSRYNDPTETPDFDEVFESEDLSACLDHYKDHGDIVPLENAISVNEVKIEQAVKSIQLLIDAARASENSFMANRLIEVRNNLHQ